MVVTSCEEDALFDHRHKQSVSAQVDATGTKGADPTAEARLVPPKQQATLSKESMKGNRDTTVGAHCAEPRPGPTSTGAD